MGCCCPGETGLGGFIIIGPMIWESKKIGKDGIYRIRNRKSNLYLTSGAHLSMEPKGENRPSQLWLIDEVKPEAFFIVSLKLGTALTRAD